ncbi:ATPase [Pseudobacteroides cellulosolvens]|nr:ATPase [Pseudobacteroides cellulosolvens]
MRRNEMAFMDHDAELEQLKIKYDSIRKVFFNMKGKEEQLQQRKSELEVQLQKILDNIDLLEKVSVLLKKASEYAREQSRLQIESLVTNCLQFIFNSALEFKIEINEVRGRPEAEFYVLSNINDQIIKTRPQDSRGGGVVDVVSLAIRIAMIEYGSMNINGPIILDEPAKHVSDDYIIQVAEFLKQISTMFRRQVIIITHNKHLNEIADKWFYVDMVDGVSKVTFNDEL